MQRYDRDSGQVYTETVVHAKRWRPCPGKKIYRSTHGVEPLVEMAIRKITANPQALTSEALRACPPAIVDMIWKAIRRSGREDLHTWRLFTESGQSELSYPYTVSHSEMYKPLVDFFLDLTSPTTKWLVHLELSEVHCSSLQFKAIAMMDNLESLYIKNAEGRHADFVQGKEGKLPNLKTFFVQNAKNLTINAFCRLKSFSALELFCVNNTGITKKNARRNSNTFGWKLADISDFADRAEYNKYENASKSNADGRTSFLLLANDLAIEHHAQDQRKLSRLRCTLGRNLQSKKQTPLDEILCFSREPGAYAPTDDKETTTENLGPPTKKQKLAPKIRQNKHIFFEDLLDGL